MDSAEFTIVKIQNCTERLKGMVISSPIHTEKIKDEKNNNIKMPTEKRNQIKIKREIDFLIQTWSPLALASVKADQKGIISIEKITCAEEYNLKATL